MMSATGKAKKRAEERAGAAKDAVSGAPGDHDLKSEGKGDQGSADLRPGGGHITDGAGDAKEPVGELDEELRGVVGVRGAVVQASGEAATSDDAAVDETDRNK